MNKEVTFLELQEKWETLGNTTQLHEEIVKFVCNYLGYEVLE